MTGPAPGRPLTLGSEEDLGDAAVLLSIAAGGRSLLERGRARSGPVRVLREAVWFIWEHPRLPGPLVVSHYPTSYPWSARARERWIANGGRRPPGGWGFVIEHLYPRELLAGDLLDALPVADADGVLVVLATRLMAVVITRDEDRMLPTRRASPQRWSAYEEDPWVRYRASGLNVSEFSPLTDAISATTSTASTQAVDGSAELAKAVASLLERIEPTQRIRVHLSNRKMPVPGNLRIEQGEYRLRTNWGLDLHIDPALVRKVDLKDPSGRFRRLIG